MDTESAHRLARETQDFREVIGVSALRLNLMRPDQVEQVLNAMGPGRTFGEIAVDKGYLTPDALRSLREIQGLLDAVELGAVLILNGRLTSRSLVDHLQAFLDGSEHPFGCVPGNPPLEAK